MAGSDSAAVAGDAFQSGVAALSDGRLDDAAEAFDKVLGAQPAHAAALYNMGVIHYHAGRPGKAEPYLRRALAQRPEHADTLSVAAAVLAELGNLEEAEALAHKILSAQNADAAALNSAGQVFSHAGKSGLAEDAYRRALWLDPAYRPAALALYSHLSLRRAFDDAAAVCETALARRPRDQDLHLKRAQALWEGERPQRALKALLALLDFAPDHITALYDVSLFASAPDRDRSMKRLRALLAEGDLDDDEEAKAWFALGNHSAVQGQWEQSLACFAAGNQARAAPAPDLYALSGRAFLDRTECILSRKPPAIVSEPPTAPTPLIICGPSRSGKSLLQSWLSVHPDIAAADETGVLPRLAETDCLQDESSRRAAAELYRETLCVLGGDAKFVIDTHPTNILYLDLLLAICPDARVVLIDRNPLDTAVSVFARHFVTGGHWADNWAGIADRLQAHVRLNAHWSGWAPVAATVRFETLVTQPQPVIDAILSALELTPYRISPSDDVDSSVPVPWSSFNGHVVPRSDTVGLWRPFAPWLGSFADAYGRDALEDANTIPSETHPPKYAFADSLASFRRGEELSEVQRDALAETPALHAADADTAARNGDVAGVLEARWRAVSSRPFTHHIQHHARALSAAVAESDQHQEYARLNRRVGALWSDYRKKSRLAFGDYGTLYQSYAPAYLCGSRNTERRAATYGMRELAAGRRVLDLGCNTGFLTLAAAETADICLGIDHEPALIEIAEVVRDFAGLANASFVSADAAQWATTDVYDVVIAAAVHGWFDLPFGEFAHRLADLTAPGGAILFESQGQRSSDVTEPDFETKVSEITNRGLRIERTGTICDDGVNLRAFVVLRRDA
jgi:tetratricopeptide (TPR) repeat protein/SAM-dependent methyltransferase